VTVEPSRAPEVSVELSGREAFRIGQPNVVTVTLNNTSNVDAIGVPVVLHGIPANATVAPLFTVSEPSGAAGSVTTRKTTFDQETETVTDEEGLTVPMLVARVPAGRSVQMQYQVSVPTSSTFTVNAYSGACLATTAPDGSSTAEEHEDTVDCIGTMAGLAAGLIPGGSCVEGLSDLAVDGATAAAGGGKFLSPLHFFSWLGSGLECAAEFFPPTAVAEKAIKIVSDVGKAASDIDTADGIGSCLAASNKASLLQRGVLAIDPNELLGPAGSGSNHYISGNGALGYHVLFENLPTASAAAQRIHVSDQLDTSKLNPASVLFEEVRFGSTTYSLPYGGHELDETIDLRPAQNLLVHITANVSTGGLVAWNLQALDPDTLEPPADPSEGFLPPNQHSPEGEGAVSFSVSPTSLTSGATIANQAAIQFDSNPLIETPTWTNTIDREPPMAAIQAEGTSDPASAHVAWSGSDDASGIAFWEIKVSKDGGPYTIWRTAEAAGSDTYAATESGTYSFRAVAHDGAGNVTESSQAAITLTNDSGHGSGGSSGQTGGGGVGGIQQTQATTGNAAVTASVTSTHLLLIGLKARLALALGSGDRVVLPIRAKCPAGGANCHLQATLSAVLQKGHKAIKLGSGTVEIKPGGTSPIAAKLNFGSWRAQLKHRDRLTARFSIVFTRGSETLARTITVSLTAPKADGVRSHG
jgi:hypothetical protein